MAKNSKNSIFGLAGLLRVIAAFAGIVAFIMMFLDQIEIHKVVLGEDLLVGTYGMKAFFGDPDSADAIKNGAILPFIGYILMGVGALCGLVSLFLIKDKKLDTIVSLLSGLVMITGAIFVFFISTSLAKANTGSLLSYEYRMLFAPVFGGILGAAGGAANVVALIFKK